MLSRAFLKQESAGMMILSSIIRHVYKEYVRENAVKINEIKVQKHKSLS